MGTGGQNVTRLRTRPRAVAVPVSASDMQASPHAHTDPPVVTAFGSVPRNSTHWTMRKRDISGALVALEWAPEGERVARREWPLSSLSEEEIERRWGSGSYEIGWVKPTEAGGFKHIRGGREFTIKPAPLPQAAPAVAPPPPTPPTELEKAFQVMRLINQESDSKVSGMVQLAALLGGARSGGGLGSAELTLILQQQNEAAERRMLAALAPINAELARRREEDEEEDDEDEGGLTGAMAAAAAPLIKGKGKWAAMANFAAANPDLVKEALPVVAQAVGALADMFKKVVAPAAPPHMRSLPQAVPVHAASRTAPPPAPVREPELPGFSQVMARGASQPPPPPPPAVVEVPVTLGAS